MCYYRCDGNLVAKGDECVFVQGEPLFSSKEKVSQRMTSRLLLGFLAKEGEMRPGVVQALTQLSFNYGLPRALEIIQASPAADLLLPLVTALQQELGQETHVAKEVDEVAADIRRNMMRLSASIGLGVPTWTAEFLRDEVNLNQSRLDRLETSVGAVNDYLKGNLTGYQKMERQGSYALGTLIKPVDDNDEYDADIQILMNPNPRWEPKDLRSGYKQDAGRQQELR